MDLKEALAPGAQVARHPWELARLKVAEDLMKKHLKLDDGAPLTILDMGCGDSWFVEQLASVYPAHSYLGVDIAFTDEQLQSLGKRLEGKPIRLFRQLDEVASRMKNSRIDIVLLLDVIEHIEDEIAFLKWMQTFPQITSQTKFFITVPAFQSLFCEHDVFLEHYRRYTNASLKTALQQAQLRSLERGYFFSSLLAPRLLQVAKEKIVGRKPEDEKGIGQWNGSETQTRLMTDILWNDYRLVNSLRNIGIKLPGLSNFAIAQAR